MTLPRPRKRILIALGFAALIGPLAYADDTKDQVRPSHLLNIETSDTLAPRQLVVSEFGSSARAALGTLPNLETRLDFRFLSQSDDRMALSAGVSAKYHLFGSDSFGGGVFGQVGSQKSANGTPLGFAIARVPVTLKLSSVVLAVVPLISRDLASGASATTGGELGIAAPIVSAIDGIVETTITSTGGVTGYGYAGGVVFKPSNRISIPLVLAQKLTGEQPSLGLVGLFAHIGFEF